MDDVPEAGPQAKRPCSAAVRLYPLKSVANLRERYTESTADVFFVDGETKERLPAHREVLKVASPVFFKMLSGNWKEKRKETIPAPEDYEWESFKAAIAILYGEEVEMEESSIPDVYRVAHLYDFTGVMSTLAQQVCQWGSSLLRTVVELCAVAGDLPEGSNELLSATVEYIARHVGELSPSDFACLSYEAMKMLVQSEAITCAELVLLRTLNQWTNAQEDITLRQMKQLYSHIRFGTIPFEGLTECSVVGHDHLKLALKNHEQMVLDCVKSNLVQITPRLGQKEVFQVYPMARGVRAVVQPNRQIEVANVCSVPAFGVVYSGKQEIRFHLDLKTEADMDCSLNCSLYSLHCNHIGTPVSTQLKATLSQRCQLEHARGVRNTPMSITLDFLHCTVVLSRTGAHLLLQSQSLQTDDPCSASVEMDFSCTNAFPWVLTFGVSLPWSSRTRFTIHPPTL